LRAALGLDPSLTEKEVLAELARLPRARYQQVGELFSATTQKTMVQRGTMLVAAAGAAEGADLLQSLKRIFLTKDNEPFKDMVTKPIEKKHPEESAWLVQQQQWFLDLHNHHALLSHIGGTVALLHLAADVRHRFEENKRARGLYDFDDLIARTASLLTAARSAAWVLYKLDAGLEHILVDEAQDTSPQQWRIIQALAAEFFAGEGKDRGLTRTLFVVGDHKQSIFSFQGADVREFETARDIFRQHMVRGAETLHDVQLTVSYRSAPVILQAVDMVFAGSNPARHGLVPPAYPHVVHESNRRDAPGVVEIWPLIGPEEKEELDHWQAPVDREPARSHRRRLARHIAGTIHGWLGRRLLLAENRVVKPSDILILMQTRGPLFSMLISELRRRGVPVAGADRLRLLDNIAILDIMALIQFMLLPGDDHSLACVLKSPLMPDPLDDKGLMDLAIERGAMSLWERLARAEGTAVASCRSALERWRDEIRAARPYDFLAMILRERRQAIALRLGTEALDACDALLDLALDYEQKETSSLAGFLHWLMRSEYTVRRDMDQTTEEVRLMTVHGAKGLEAEIVILPDCAAPVPKKQEVPLLKVPVGNGGIELPLWLRPHRARPDALSGLIEQSKAETQEEKHRLLYVAMTRARNELYVCGSHGVQQPAKDCWYELIAQAVESEPGVFRWVEGGFEGQELRRLGTDPVYREEQRREDPEAAPLPAWATAAVHPPARLRPQAQAVTRLAKTSQAPLAGVQEALRRGRALHAILEDLPAIPAERRDAYVRRKLTKAGLAAELADSLTGLIARPDLQAFFAPGTQGEVAFHATVDGLTISGQVDRLAVGDTTIDILDYKSDALVPQQLGADHPYARQMALYAAALERAYPGREVRAHLLWTAAGRLETIAPALLAQAFREAQMSRSRDLPLT
jgi:ATP-dependent helicase/nuclease subunit A